MEEFRIYLKHIEGYPDFRDDPAGASELVEAMRSGSDAATLALIESGLRLIAELTAAHCRKWNAWTNYFDLVQQANTEVSERMHSYDPSKATLESFVSYRTRMAFIDFWKNASVVHVTDHYIQLLRALKHAQAELTIELGREPTPRELAEALCKDEAAVQVIQTGRVRIVGITDQEEETDRGMVSIRSIPAPQDLLREIEASELQDILNRCLEIQEADLLLSVVDGTESFRRGLARSRGHEVSDAAARQAKRRLLRKLRECLESGSWRKGRKR